ncbi:MAG: ABC transporter permease [Prevotella sp.]|nr:ABC transporter permease [Prevotella sp.]
MNQKKKRERITPAERKEAYKEASKFVLDLAKLVFAGIILAGIMDMDISKAQLLTIGGTVVAILTVGGAYLYYRAIKKY